MKLFLNRLSSLALARRRFYCSMNSKKGLVLGAFCKDKNDYKLTSFAQTFDEKNGGKVGENLKILDGISKGETRVFWNIGDFPCVAVTGVEEAVNDPLENLNASNENVRNAACAGYKALSALKLTDIYFDNFGKYTQQAAEGAYLASYKFQAYKEEAKRTKIPNIDLVEGAENNADWERGKILASAQNFARILMENPANLMTPTIFVETVKKQYEGLKNLELIAHDEEWARKKQNGSLFKCY
jgi:aminopeptidase